MLRFVVAFFALAAAALAATSYAFEKEGHYKVTFTGGSVAFNVLRSCVSTTSTTCEWLKVEEVSFPNKCTRTKTNVGLRIYSMMSLGPFGGFLALVGVAASFPNSRGAGIARLLIMVFSFLSLGVSCGLFYMNVSWLYCDEKVCDLSTTFTNCEESFTLYFWLHAGACGSALLGTVVAAPALAQAESAPEAPPPETEPTAAEASNDDASAPATENNGDTAKNSDETQAQAPDSNDSKPDAAEAEPAAHANEQDGADDPAAEDADAEEAGDEDGDWVWDEESGMYWSESAYMYLEPESGMYYDPNSGWWYDPETEQWIEPEEEAAEE